ncbi:MAG: Stp1/IreP family PP2C-type Ser/Thr phosphatase [Anaerolineae bacterium]|nr:Stp1/IreP family PP2C-type Ser/Thr phosphatase [Anaerolineae bacterium]
MFDPGYKIRLRSSARTSVGQVRENNEDNIHLLTGDHFVLAVVADGMGGAAAGEQASRIAVETIQTGLTNHSDEGSLESVAYDTLTERLREVIQNANLSIMMRAAKEPEMRGMGTTVTLAFVREGQVTIAHVGDSRAYHVSAYDGEITQITSDHSFVEALLAAGHITREQAEEHPMRNVLYRALGQTEDIDVDLYKSQLHVGDRLVLCSDGLTRHVKPHEIARVVLSDDAPEVTSQRLIDMANARGGEDNVSVIVVLAEVDGDAQAEAVDTAFEPEQDEEDTLILRDQVQKSGSDSVRSELPVTFRTTSDCCVLARQKQKMAAERLSDTADERVLEPAAVEDITLPTAIPMAASAVLDPSFTRRSEGDREGRDTLNLDQ